MIEPEITTYPDRDAQAKGLAEQVTIQIGDALEARGRALIAVPGGSTPGPFLTALSQADLDWPRVDVMLTDERCVPVTHARSNTALLQSTLLDHANGQLITMAGESGEEPATAAARLAPAIRARLPLDVCVLGMGEDMHTASLFPGSPQLSTALVDPDDLVLMAIDVPDADEPRLTLTAPVLRRARAIHILIAGTQKRLALTRACEAPDDLDAPIRAILSASAPITVHYSD